MPKLRSKDDASVCSFTFSDGRRCSTPRCSTHPHLCYFHAQKEAAAAATQKMGIGIGSWVTGNYVSACDLAGALGRVFSCTAQGKIKPKTASTLAYLGQTLLQSIQAAQHEYVNAYGADNWRRVIRSGTVPPPALPPPAPKPDPAPPSAPAPAPAPSSTPTPESVPGSGVPPK